MKKLLFTAAIVIVAMTANAQVWLGGNVAFNKTKIEHSDQKATEFSIAPEVGYNLNDKFAVAAALTYQKIDQENVVTQNKYGINPYVRYNAVKWNNVTLFLDGGFSYEKTKDEYDNGQPEQKYTNISIGIKPGLAYSIDEKVGLVAHFGFLGYEKTKREYDSSDVKKNYYGFDLGTSSVTFGVYFNL